MAHYQTAQKKLLLDFLREHSRQAFTIEELAAALEVREHAPGKSTLYRLMPLLVQEGRVKRFVRGTSRQFLYQMMGESCRTHLHLKCSICGQMVHMGHKESLELVRMIDKKYHFSVSEGDTVLFGLCENCRTAPA